MKKPTHRVQPAWRYDESQGSALALEALLRKHGVQIVPGSPMETHVLEVMRLVYDKASGSPPDDDQRDRYRTLVGVHELANAILSVQDSPSFDSLLPHLQLLSSGSALQNIPSSASDSVTNKLFELFAGSLAMQCGQDVTLDDPHRSKGDNPDVLATLCGRRWGIACKVIHSLNPEGFVTHLEKGIEQIERSAAEIGVVLINLKNVLPHDVIWPLGEVPGSEGELATGCWSDPAMPFAILTETLDHLGDTLVAYLPPDHLSTVFRARRSIPGFLLWASSVTAAYIDGKPTASSVHALNFRALKWVSPDIENVLARLTWATSLGSSRGPIPAC